MDDHPLTCTPETEIDEVRRMMLGRHARYLPVMTERTLMGVISFYDVAKAVVDSQDFENRMLKAYIRDWPVEDRDEQRVVESDLLGTLMSGSTFGHLFRVTNFGESHGPAIGCVIDGCPPGMALSRGRHPARARPAPARHLAPRHAAQRARHGRDPVRRVRGRDHRHADLPADPQHRPAQQGLRQHPRHLPPRPRRLHLLAQVRPARPARRRPRVGAADRADGRRRRGRAQVAARSSTAPPSPAT